MKQNIYFFVVLMYILYFFNACLPTDIAQFVDPNIGGIAPLLTAKAPTVHRPHSMVRVFPLTKPNLN